MKKYINAVLLLVTSLFGQTVEEAIQIKIGGYIKSELFFDSRQTINFREGHFLLYPANENLDVNGTDINKNSSFNMLSIQSRINANISGPSILEAKSTAFAEGEFFGTSDADVNGFRLRHAYINLRWKSTNILIGQTWHPLFISDVFPQVVSFNTGVPFIPFSRNPQIRITQYYDEETSEKFNNCIEAH